ncbi:MAG: hypothetical protein IK078_05135 [Lachnospiraceae bacterium]|nr:hypothetical protein [Lachnospiraceae bacterium]
MTDEELKRAYELDEYLVDKEYRRNKGLLTKEELEEEAAINASVELINARLQSESEGNGKNES